MDNQVLMDVVSGLAGQIAAEYMLTGTNDWKDFVAMALGGAGGYFHRSILPFQYQGYVGAAVVGAAAYYIGGMAIAKMKPEQAPAGTK